MTKVVNGTFSGQGLEGELKKSDIHWEDQEKGPPDEAAHIVPGSKEDPYRPYRFLKQSCIVATWISIGLYAGVIGPTLPDLRDSIGVDMDQISATLMFKTIGFLTGAVVGGFLFNIFYKRAELIMLIGIAGMATISFAPWGQSLGAMCFFFWTAGTSEGIVNVGGNPMVMHIWEEKAPTPLLITHFGFGVGSVIAPLLAKPFIAVRSEDTGNTTTVSSVIQSHVHHTSWNYPNIYVYNIHRWEFEASRNTKPFSADSEFETDIKFCYAISGVLILCISLYQLYFVIRGPPKGFKNWAPDAPLTQMLNPGSCTQGNSCLGIQLLVCLFIFYGLSSGGQSAFADFLYSFATESDLQMSEDEAATLNSMFWLCYTLGRLFGGFIAHWVPVPIILGTSAAASIGVMAVLILFGEADPTVFWIFTCLFGFTITILFPTGMAWSNIYLHMNSMSTMVLLMGSSCGRAPLQYLAGYVYEEYGPRYIMYVSISAYIGCMVIFVVMQTVGSCNGTKVNRDAKVKTGGDDGDLVVKVSSVEHLGNVNKNMVESLSNDNYITRF